MGEIGALTVLLVEDDVSIARLFETALERRGHEVVHAGSVREALVAIHAIEFDRLVCDWRLVDGDARPVLEAARTRRPEAGRIVVSGDPALVASRVGSLAHLRLCKPVSLEDFCAAVEDAGHRVLG